MSFDLHLKPSCSGCGSTSDLYGSNCKHLTLCISCGKNMAQNHHNCSQCNLPVTRLIREYNVRTTPPTTTTTAKDNNNNKSYFIGKFLAGLPSFSQRKKKWSIKKKQGLLQRDKNKNWVLEDGTGQFRYQGVLECLQSANYYLLVMQGKEFVAVPADSWYNFNKSVEYKQLTLEEAEEKIKGRRKTAVGYERWMMKTSNTGPTAFGHKKDEEEEVGEGNSRGIKKEDGEGNGLDRLGRNKKDEFDDEEGRRGDEFDDEEGRRGGDYDIEDDDVEKGDGWEHDEMFTDDDETNDLDDKGDLDPDVPGPSEIDQDEEDEDDEANGEEIGGLSISGKEIKKLLGKTGGLNDSDDENNDGTGLSPVLAPKKRDAVKEEPTDNSLSKLSTSTTSQGKRKSGVADDVKVAIGAPLAKKVKTENESKPPANDGAASALTSSSTPKERQPEPTGPVTEEEIRAFLMQNSPVTPPALVDKFKKRLKSQEDREAIAELLKRISRIDRKDGLAFVVLKDK